MHNYLELNCTALQDQTGQSLYFLPIVGPGISQLHLTCAEIHNLLDHMQSWLHLQAPVL